MKYYRSYEKRLAVEQRKLSRHNRIAKEQNRNLTECKNYQKQRLKVAKIHERIANQRNDFLHKLSSRLTDENHVTCVEDLNVKGMVRNRKMSKSIADVSWDELIRLFEYKSDCNA